MLLVEVLQSIGIATSTAKNGRQALALLEEGMRPDAILLDLMMPEMDGWEFRRRQRMTPPFAAIPIVVLSANGDVGDRTLGIDADGFILKPPTVDALTGEIERVLSLRPRAA